MRATMMHSSLACSRRARLTSSRTLRGRWVNCSSSVMARSTVTGRILLVIWEADEIRVMTLLIRVAFHSTTFQKLSSSLTPTKKKTKKIKKLKKILIKKILNFKNKKKMKKKWKILKIKKLFFFLMKFFFLIKKFKKLKK